MIFWHQQSEDKTVRSGRITFHRSYNFVSFSLLFSITNQLTEVIYKGCAAAAELSELVLCENLINLSYFYYTCTLVKLFAEVEREEINVVAGENEGIHVYIETLLNRHFF